MSAVAEYLNTLPEPRRAEAQALDQIFRDATGFQPKLWGKLIGYGQYHYRYDTGREGDFLATGFGVQSAKFSLHILPGYAEFPDIAARLGKHKRGKSCWYFNKLTDVDRGALSDLIRAGLKDLESHWPVQPT